MRPDRSFRRTAVIVALAHVAVVAVVYAFSVFGKKPEVPQVLWLEGGSLGGGDITGEPAPTAAEPEPAPEPPPPPEPPPVPPPTEVAAVPPVPVAPSELVTPKATPEPATPKPATPKPETPRPATPKPETPKPTPKPTPKTTPKPKPATPKATPKKSSAATPKEKSSAETKPKGTPAAGKTEGSAATGSTTAATGGNGPGTGNGKGPGKAGSGTGASEFGWYFTMIHDRFHTRWEQPTSIIRGAQDFVTTLKLRISKDGTILGREIVKSSGDTVMDGSVMAAAEKVQQIDPLPAGLGDGHVFEVNVAFKLDQGQ